MKKEVIFVDCFNTIILRKKSPNDVLFSWCKKLSENYSGVKAITFYKLFKSCELELARIKKQETDEREYTLTDILYLIFYKLSPYNKVPNTTIESFVSCALTLYYQTEMENQYANKKIIEKLKYYKAQGKKIYVLSDFYCGKEVLNLFLQNLKIDELFDDVFASCEYGKSKRNGTLYQEVLAKLNLSSKNVLMIGDNIWSDKFSAKKMGIKSHWIFKPYKHTSRELKSYKTKLYISKEHQELFEKNENNSQYSNYAFPLYIFTKRLADSLIRNNQKNVFFLAREGYFLKKLFDSYCKNNNITSIKSHYLEVSRGSIQSAVLKPINEENFDLLFNTAKWFGLMSVNTFLRSLNFSYEQIDEICAELNVKSKKMFFNFKNSKIFKKLIKSNIFLNYYEKMRIEQHDAFNEYLKSFGVDFEKDGINVVDVGWSGTMQNLLKKYFLLNNQQVKVTGYYIGYFKKKFDKDNKKIGLLYAKKLSNVWPQSKVFRYRMRDYEQILRAPKNRVVGYSVDNDRVIYDEFVNEVQFHKEVIENVQNQIFEKFNQICELKKCQYDDFDSIAMREYFSIIKKFSYQDFKWLHKCHNAHYDSFGYVGYTLKFNLPILKFIGLRIVDFAYLIVFGLFVYIRRIVW